MESNTKSRGVLVFVVLTSALFIGSSYGFGATVDNTFQSNRDHMVIFPKVINKKYGELYDPHTGIFTVPSSGSYLMVLKMQGNCPKDNMMRFDFWRVQDSTSFLMATLDSTKGGSLKMWYTAKLKKGDNIYIKAEVVKGVGVKKWKPAPGCFIEHGQFNMNKNKNIW